MPTIIVEPLLVNGNLGYWLCIRKPLKFSQTANFLIAFLDWDLSFGSNLIEHSFAQCKAPDPNFPKMK
jgi:hypothetical protein